MKLYDTIKRIPIYFLIVLVPLIVKEYYYNVNLNHLAWYGSDGNQELDLFLYWKAIAVICTGICMLLILFFQDYKKIQKIPIVFIPLAIYELMAILSSVLSSDSYYSFHGIRDQFESLWVLLAYGIISYYSYTIIENEKDLKKVVKWLILGILGILFIGLSQFIGLDFFKFIFQNKTYQFNFEHGRVYGTFYNPNYVGTYISLLSPIPISLFIYIKDIKVRFFLGGILTGMFILLIGSKSTTGFLVTGIALILILLFYRNKWLKHRKIIIILSIFTTILLISTREFISENIINKVKVSFDQKNDKEIRLNKIETNDENIKLEYSGNNLYIEFVVENEAFSEFTFNIEDDEHQGIASNINHDTGVITLTDERFFGITFSPVYISDMNNLLAFTITIDEHKWNFTNQTDGNYYFITSAAKLDKIEESPSAIFTDFTSFASGRGYIWSKTIPLLKDTLVLGTGADTFLLSYPNNDYVANYNNNFVNTYVTRPHNMYLQMGVQTGLISLISFIFFYMIYAISSIRLFWKNKYKTYGSNIGLGIFIGTVSYMLIGMINDSTITVSPIFWCLIGIGIAINQKVLLVDTI